jgi:hypothetical protein
MICEIDEESWRFFCSNSPKLVKRFEKMKSFARVSSKSKVDVPALLVARSQKAKNSVRYLEAVTSRAKSKKVDVSLQSVYRDQSVKLSVCRTNFRNYEKSFMGGRESKGSGFKRSLSPITLGKKSFLSKRFNVLSKLKPCGK